MLEDLDKLKKLPGGIKLFTMDADTMRTNIGTDHGLEVFKNVIEMFKVELLDDFPKDLVMWAMKIVMHYNVFEFGGHTFQEFCGTAVVQEICILLVKYKRYLILYKRLIDDKCGLWNDCGYPRAWDRFCEDVNNFVSGKLKWVIDDRSKEGDFFGHHNQN
ncbi:hypothetical protein ACHAWF_017788 [Thalassiosira exigua]